MSNFNDFIDELVREALNELGRYRLELGVFSGKSNRKHTEDYTNAEILFINENGSPLQHIPSRPVLQYTIEYANKNLIPKAINRCIDLFLMGEPMETEIRKLAMRIEAYARKLIYSNDGTFIRNAPETIKKKKGNHPLFDTGQMARSITCRVIKK